MRCRFPGLLVLAACASGVPAAPPSLYPAEICDNDKDDDGNGRMDCADPACAEDPHCPVCGDGFRNDREPCEGTDLGGSSCLALGFNGGGILRCGPHCSLDVGGCRSHEDCARPGDEDGNGLADCADPACAANDDCLTLTPLDPPASAHVSSRLVLAFRAADGAGHPLVGRSWSANWPPAASIEWPTWTDDQGVVRVTVRLGRLPGKETFMVVLGPPGPAATVEIAAVEPPPGTVLSILDPDGIAGQDVGGAASTVHVGAPIGVQVADDGTLYVAEACRVTTVSPEGMFSASLGGGACGGEWPHITVSGIALSPARSTLYVADAGAGVLRSLDLAAHRLTSVAGGGSLIGPAGDGGPASEAALDPRRVDIDPSGRPVIRDGRSSTFRVVDPDTGIIDTVVPWKSGTCAWLGVDACSDGCTVAWDPAGTPFVSGNFCASYRDENGYVLQSIGPGVARYQPEDGSFTMSAGRQPGLAPSGVPASLAEFEPISAQAFDPAGNLYLLAGNSLYRIDAATAVVEKLAGDGPAFAGDDAPLGAALFSSPSAMAFGPGGDLYVADTGNGVVRRIVGLGQAPR